MSGSLPQISQSMPRLASQIRLRGYAVAHDDNMSELSEEISRFCKEQTDTAGRVTTAYDEVRYQAEVTNSIAYSASDMVPHTDGSFRTQAPRIVALKCMHPDAPDSGKSIVVDGYRLLDDLTETEISLLSTTDFFFRAPASPSEGIYSPVIQYKDGLLNIRFRYDQKYRPQSESTEAQDAVRKFASLCLEPKYRVEIALAECDVLILDNSRVMHGRTRLSGHVERLLSRAYFYAEPEMNRCN